MTEKPVDDVVAPPVPAPLAPVPDTDSAPAVSTDGDPEPVVGTAADPGSADDDAAPADDDAPIEVLHRRAPRYGRFIVMGLLLGGLVSFLTAILTRGWSGLSTSNTFWLLLLSFGVLGMLAGAATALVLDRRSIAKIEAEKK